MSDKKIDIAVFFGAKSFEHDVSILTGIEVCRSLDDTKYNVIPIYLDMNNQFWTGDALMSKTIYPLRDWGKSMLKEAKILVGESRPTLRIKEQGMFFSSYKNITFDVAFCAFHGDYGEDGAIQGLFEVANIPYTGCRALSSSIAMNKSIAKMLVKNKDIPTLGDIVIKNHRDDFFDIDKLTDEINIPFPLIVKPVSLGSSIGVSKANNKDELNVSILQIFALGEDVLIEPFVDNLEEYNLSATKIFNNKIMTSSIERPNKKDAEFLGFIEKYKSGGSKKCGSKCGKFNNDNASGMLSMSRTINPDELSIEEQKKLRNWTEKIFETLNCNGVVRVDFLCNSKTREFYFGEINTIPGSLSSYLWEANEPPYVYTDITTAMIDEAIRLHNQTKGRIALSSSEIFKEKN
ncbi:MAG: hypothetical protein LBC92_03310 [Rickettsiales bacterium]|jgi:D-alanine-D-alanine ligase|nr:hypothetical protein [Rickettsiales bacterium]